MSDLAAPSSVIERVFALRGVQPFDRLPPDELALLAEVAKEKDYPPGAVIHYGDTPLVRLLVLAGGRMLDAQGAAAGPIVGAASLLRNVHGPALTADPAGGARLIEINKRHFFTLARECPEFVLGLIELGEHGAPASAP